jgi:phosphohistidine phosphatase SixA
MPPGAIAGCVMRTRHVLIVLLACAAIVVGPAVAVAAAQEAVFLVRHAERLDDSNDSPLSAQGRTRAARLAQMLRDARITAIYVTEFQRTAQTAQPLADLLKLPLIKMPAADPGALVTRLRASDALTRALVVSHSDRLPILLHDLGVPEVTIAAAEYDDLFIVVPGDRPSRSILMRLRY